ncbi:MAG TPA: hypothetical protein VJR29_08360 [bacterium]|nr:hypothetical protein [bacterium]
MGRFLSWIPALALIIPTGLWAQQEALLLTIKKEVERPRPPIRAVSEGEPTDLENLAEIYQQAPGLELENPEDGYEAPAAESAEPQPLDQ